MLAESSESAAPVIAAQALTRKFGASLALDGVDLAIPRGGVFGLVGGNGAGKTTFIRHVLGLLKPTTGTIRVFGLDPVADPVAVLARIGYLSEDRDLPDWMRVGELMRYTQAFYPNWDESYARGLLEMFRLDPKAKVGSLSRGQRAQAGLLAALAHRPDLLLLDEPSSGLDPIVRRDILGAIIRTVADEGRTVLFSSHLLDEVERVSDRIAMIARGRVAACGPLDEVKAAHRCLTLRFGAAPVRPPHLSSAAILGGSDREWVYVCDGAQEGFRAEAARLGAELVEERAATLDEIFFARVGARPETEAPEER